jgi:hypothetical protein
MLKKMFTLPAVAFTVTGVVTGVVRPLPAKLDKVEIVVAAAMLFAPVFVKAPVFAATVPSAVWITAEVVIAPEPTIDVK